MTRTPVRSRLARLESATARPVELLPAFPAPAAEQSGDLAAELAAAFGRQVDAYRECYKVSREEAVQRAADAPAVLLERALRCPPDQVGWGDLHALAQSDPQKARDRWEQVKSAAREGLRNGFRAAQALDGAPGGCWERAQFLA